MEGNPVWGWGTGAAGKAKSCLSALVRGQICLQATKPLPALHPLSGQRPTTWARKVLFGGELSLRDLWYRQRAPGVLAGKTLANRSDAGVFPSPLLPQ